MHATLYLLVGYPGSGKTTASKVLQSITGATHLWADHVRKEMFEQPTYSEAENVELYDHLNTVTADLLANDTSVIFDTNFNFYKDRQKLRQIASDNHAETVLLWVQAPKDIAKQRATADAHQQDSRVLGNMTSEDFERLTNHLEEPLPEEDAIIVDGTKISTDYINSLVFKK